MHESSPATALSGPAEASFRAAFERYEEPLFRYAQRILRDQERARDVVQDTFMKLHEADVSADDPRLGAWLYRVCRNRAIDIRRREGRVRAMNEPPEIAVAPSGEHHMAVREVFEKAERLSPRKARVLSLRYRDGRSYQQIADQTGLSVSHVGVLLHDSIKSLRRHLGTVAAVLLVAGAGAWGVNQSRRPTAPQGHFVRVRPTLPLVERGTAEVPVDRELYGPEEFYGPEEEPQKLHMRRRLFRPRAKPRSRPERELYMPYSK